MWFRSQQGIIKNSICELDNGGELATYPHMYNGNDCEIYDRRKECFRAFTGKDYTAFNGLTYRTVWSRGCPYGCIYCANSAFIQTDANFRKIRYSPVKSIIDEIRQAIANYPFIATIAFYDDNFISIPIEDLKEFTVVFKAQIGLPFVVFGLHPNAITEEKMELLARAGMNRGRMGIQSGNAAMLEFYRRGTSLEKIEKSAGILAKLARRYSMIPPAYDIISDNPLETREEVVQTLSFLYKLERPYTLTIFSLRVFPKTQLWEYFERRSDIDIRSLVSSYLDTKKSMTNVLLYLLGTFKPPRLLFNLMVQKVQGYEQVQKQYRLAHLLCKVLYLMSRAVQHLKKFDFSTLSGGYLFTLWRWGMIRQHRKTGTAG
jgi:radical SAM superfamily enzyme YgiQ (UPF0313 family)